MRNTTIHLPELYLKLIDEIVKEREFPCTSEFIRVAIRKMLKRDKLFLQNPKIGQNSEHRDVVEVMLKKPSNQKHLDQFTVMLNHNPVIQKRLEAELKPQSYKQQRIDIFWK